MAYQDKPSVEKLKLLHPKLRAEAQTILDEINAKLTGNTKIRYAMTLRTFAEQDALYRQGRTAKGPVVTQARGGQSIHNYGLALDIVLLIDKDKNGTYETASWDMKVDGDADKLADWLEAVAVFEKYGWSWGGRWKGFVDNPHFEKSFGLTWRQLLAKHDAKQVDAAGYVII